MNFQGRTAIVTGAARGIGRAICLELARQGCDVAFNYSRSADQAATLVSEIAGLGRRAKAVAASVTSPEAAESMVAAVKAEFGSIDYLVNNAGITRDKLILRMTEKDWDEVLDTNLKGAFVFSKAVVPLMLKARFGSILNISSISGLTGIAGQANYSASKAGVIGLTKTVAREFAARGINVNAIAPGYIQTPMTEVLPEKAKEELKRLIPMERLGQPEDVAHAVLFLVSETSSYITGNILNVNGGIYM